MNLFNLTAAKPFKKFKFTKGSSERGPFPAADSRQPGGARDENRTDKGVETSPRSVVG
jgi:hypothetical protein